MTKEAQENDETLLDLLEIDHVDVDFIDLENKNILFYIAGYNAYSSCKVAKCPSCIMLLKREAEIPFPYFPVNEANNLAAHQEKENFLMQIGLCFPTELVYILSVQAWAFYNVILCKDEAKSFLFSSTNSRKVFCCQLGNDIAVMAGHRGAAGYQMYKWTLICWGRKNVVCQSIQYNWVKKECSERNSNIHMGRKRETSGRNNVARKAGQLQSQNSV